MNIGICFSCSTFLDWWRNSDASNKRSETVCSGIFGNVIVEVLQNHSFMFVTKQVMTWTQDVPRDGFGFVHYETLFCRNYSSSQLITSAFPSCPNSVHDPWSIWNCVMQLMFQEVVVLFYLQCKRCIGQGRHHISPRQEVAYRQQLRCNIMSRSVCECLFRNH